MVYEVLRKYLLQDQHTKICTDCLRIFAYLVLGLFKHFVFCFLSCFFLSTSCSYVFLMMIKKKERLNILFTGLCFNLLAKITEKVGQERLVSMSECPICLSFFHGFVFYKGNLSNQTQQDMFFSNLISAVLFLFQSLEN